MTALIKPKALKKGSTIGLFSPAYYVTPGMIKNMRATLEELGYNIFVHPQVEEQDESMAGKPENRVAAMHDLFKDPDIDAVLCTSGGYGALEFLNDIDYDLIGENPKILAGYSDNSALLAAVFKKTGLVTFHGPNGRRFRAGDYLDALSIESFLRVLSGDTPKYTFPIEDYDPQIVKEGVVEAPLNGGNHILLTSLIGTEYLPDYDDCIFFTESNRPVFSDVDTNLWHFKTSGATKNIKALILGEMKGQHAHTETLSHIRQPYSFEQLAKRHHGDVPSVIDFPCGHHQTILTFPLGINHRLTCERGKPVVLEQLESAVY